MPLYVYKCERCGLEKEEIEPITAPTTRPCSMNILHGVDASQDEGYQVDSQMCTGTMRRIPQAASFKFTNPPPTYQKPKT